MSHRKLKRTKQPSARALFAECMEQLALLNHRYETLFHFAKQQTAETLMVTIERDMKAGETLAVRVPMTFTVR